VVLRGGHDGDQTRPGTSRELDVLWLPHPALYVHIHPGIGKFGVFGLNGHTHRGPRANLSGLNVDLLDQIRRTAKTRFDQ
jgi:hypothetical protein